RARQSKARRKRSGPRARRTTGGETMTKHSARRVSTRTGPLLSVLGAVLALLLLAHPAAAGQWHVSGQVFFQNGAPAPYATVTIHTPSGYDFSTQADGQG